MKRIAASQRSGQAGYPQGVRRRVLLQFLRILQLRLGLMGLSIILFMAAGAPWLATHDPFALADELIAPPGREHWLGTDGLGRDIFSMLLYGVRTSLLIGLVAALVSAVIGTVVGGFAGYYGGRIDIVLSELNNLVLMLPTFFLILIVVAMFGGSMVHLMLVIGLTSWAGNARIMRAQTLSLRERTFVLSLIAIGKSRAAILFRHILPNAIAPVLVNTTTNISVAIVMESSLSFLGLGDAGVISWGRMVYSGQAYLTTGWWISIAPGLMIMLTVLSFYLIGDGLQRLLNPRQGSRP